jgi:hypothetical protein
MKDSAKKSLPINASVTYLEQGKSLLRYMVASCIALAACQLALAQAAFEYESVLQKARTYLGAENAGDALAKADQAMSLDPARWEAYAIAGEALMKLSRYHEAEGNLNRAIDRAPNGRKGFLRDLLSECMIGESASVASSVPKAESRVQRGLAEPSNSKSNTGPGTRGRTVEHFRAQGAPVSSPPNAGIPSVFNVCYASSRSGVCESSGQLTVHGGRLYFNSQDRNQSFSRSCSEVADISSFTRESKASPSFRASTAEGVAFHFSGREEVFFVNRQATEDHTNSVDTILDALKRECR